MKNNLFFLLILISLEARAQKLFGLFGSDEKKSPSEKMSIEIETLLDSAKKNKNENALTDLDKVMELMRKQTQAKSNECKGMSAAKGARSCFDDLVYFQEKMIDRLYDIRKEFLARHHARVLEELEQTKTLHRETVKQAFQQP